MSTDIRCGRLDPEEIRQNFSELHTPLTELTGHPGIRPLPVLP